jgi:hypothetical protein
MLNPTFNKGRVANRRAQRIASHVVFPSSTTDPVTAAPRNIRIITFSRCPVRSRVGVDGNRGRFAP